MTGVQPRTIRGRENVSTTPDHGSIVIAHDHRIADVIPAVTVHVLILNRANSRTT
jgi:hypothetical protein